MSTQMLNGKANEVTALLFGLENPEEEPTSMSQIKM